MRNNIRGKLWLGLYAAVGAMVLLCAGCGDENADEARGWRRNAAENAVQYVQQKYGFQENEIEVLDADSTRSYGLFSSSSRPETMVSLRARGVDIVVDISGENTGDLDGADNYQKDQIQKALREVVEEYSFYDVIDCEISYGLYMDEPYMLRDLYDADDDSTITEKQEALFAVFGKEGETKSTNIPSVEILLCHVEGVDMGLDSETMFLAEDVLGYNSVTIHSVAFVSENAVRTRYEGVEKAEPYVDANCIIISEYGKTRRAKGSDSYDTEYHFYKQYGYDDMVLVLEDDESEVGVTSRPISDADVAVFNGKGTIDARTRGTEYTIDYKGESALYIFMENPERQYLMGEHYWYEDGNGGLYESYHTEQPQLYAPDGFVSYKQYMRNIQDLSICFIYDAK